MIEPSVLLGFATNLGSFAFALGVYVVWKRLESCNSSCHTSWFTCESPAMRERKERRKMDLMKKAMIEFQRESIKRDATIEISNESPRKSPEGKRGSGSSV